LFVARESNIYWAVDGGKLFFKNLTPLVFTWVRSLEGTFDVTPPPTKYLTCNVPLDGAKPYSLVKKTDALLH
jgi:hypothetical protein